MNNLERELIAILEDLLSNRQKDVSGEVVKYCQSDIEIYMKMIDNIEKGLDKNDSNELLINIYQAIVRILRQNKI